MFVSKALLLGCLQIPVKGNILLAVLFSKDTLIPYRQTCLLADKKSSWLLHLVEIAQNLFSVGTLQVMRSLLDQTSSLASFFSCLIDLFFRCLERPIFIVCV